MARKPGMSRDDLINANTKIVGGIVAEVAKRSPDAILIVVTNPLDVMAQLALNVSKFPRHRVIGMAGVLDAARFRLFIARELNVSVRDVYAFVLGGHGDSMVPCVDYSTVGGVPLRKLLSPEALARLVKRTQNGGGEIVGLLKTGSAYYAPAAAIAEMVESIVLDNNRILPCAAYLEGEYGISGVYCGVPCKLSRAGLSEIVEIPLSADESAALKVSAEAVREQVGVMTGSITA
jgi:malate dehydrogenase